MNANKESRGKGPLILNLGTRWRWSISRPGSFTLREESRYLLNRGLGEARSLSGGFEEGKNCLPLPGFESAIGYTYIQRWTGKTMW
jgi:hypothetical protein